MESGTSTTRQLETLAVVAAWFVLNIAMGSSTKWIYLYGKICYTEGNQECKAFVFPLTITVIHMLFSWAMCHVQLYYVRGKPKGSGLAIGQQFQKVAPLAFFFALSVGLGNLSLKYIYPSFNQMLGAMSPLITVALAVVLQRKRYNAWTWLSMPVICGGLVLCSAKEVNFNVIGAVSATGATVLRAVKSLIQGKLLSHGEKMDSVTLLYYMAPWAAAFLSAMAMVTEGLEPVRLLAAGLGPTPIALGGSSVLGLLVISGLNACFLNVFNFLVTSYTSAVTLQVLGNVKSCLSMGISVAIFRNALNWQQAVGVLICLFGVWLYTNKGGPAKSAMPKGPESPASKAAEKAELENGKNGTEMMPTATSEASQRPAAAAGAESAKREGEAV